MVLYMLFLCDIQHSESLKSLEAFYFSSHPLTACSFLLSLSYDAMLNLCCYTKTAIDSHAIILHVVLCFFFKSTFQLSHFHPSQKNSATKSLLFYRSATWWTFSDIRNSFKSSQEKLEINIEWQDDSFTPVTQYLTTDPYAIFTKHLHFPNEPKAGGYFHSPNI